MSATIHVCYGVQKSYRCKFDGSCYGEICIAPVWCERKRLTKEQKAELKAIRTEMGLEPPPGGWPRCRGCRSNISGTQTLLHPGGFDGPWHYACAPDNVREHFEWLQHLGEWGDHFDGPDTMHPIIHRTEPKP